MSILIFSTVVLAVATADTVDRGPCPGAYVDYTVEQRDLPVKKVMAPVKALRDCREAGLDVPYTVAAYNWPRSRGSSVDTREWARHMDRMNIQTPKGEQ